MCGIIGCVRKSGDVKEILLSGLRRMEYRGYDSAGIAVASGDRLLVEKKLGRLENLEKALASDGALPSSSIGLGHTRWATHGVPSDQNAHPHRGCDENLVVIHNGILENYLEVKEKLAAKGHRFFSETDSEVFAHWIEELLRESGSKGKDALLHAVARATTGAKGSFGLVVMHRDWPDRLIATRRDSPIVLGVSNDAGFIGSDVPAFLDQTNRAVFLHDDEIAEVFAGQIKVYATATLELQTREETKILWTAEQAEKRGFEHFMRKEIFEQPEVLARTAFGRLREDEGDCAFEDFPWKDPDWKRVQRIQLLACGTALHACLVGKFWLEEMTRLPVEVDFASEYRYRNPIVGPELLAIAVSQSGETADTIGAVREARKLGAKTLGICNAMGASLGREVESIILTHAGPEIGVASTKAFTAQLVALYLLAIRMGRARGTLGLEQGRERIRQLRMLRAKLERLLQDSWVRTVQDAATRFHKAKGFLFLGRGKNYPIALEGALKLKEISYMHAEGYPAGEMKHGPIALVEPDFPVVVIAPAGSVYDKVRSNMSEIRARGGKLIVVGDPQDEGLRREAETVLPIPAVPEDLSPLCTVVPLQLFAYDVARLRGCDIDKPRNLAKSVTVE